MLSQLKTGTLSFKILPGNLKKLEKKQLILLNQFLIRELNKKPGANTTVKVRKGKTTNFLPWRGTAQQLEIMYNHLLNKNLIDLSLNEFTAHFRKSAKQFPKILWNGTETSFVAFFEYLFEKNLINRLKYRYKILALHFINRNGNDFVPRQLSSVNEQNKYRQPREFIGLKKIIDELLPSNPK